MSSNHLAIAKKAKRLSPWGVISLLMILVLNAHSQQVHQLNYNNSGWSDQNLFGAVTDSKSGMAGFPTTPNNAAHVYYLSGSDHVRQLFFNGTSWSDEDLTSETGGPVALAGGAITGFSLQNFQYVFYPAADGHIHQMLYNNISWADTDLTKQTGGPASDGLQLVAIATTPNNALHVYYASTGKHIQQLYNVGGGWANQDLTSLTGGPATGGRWFSAVNIANTQFVYYFGNDRNVHELFYNNASWTDQNLAPTNVGPLGGAGIAATVIPGTKKIRVYFVGASNHVFQLKSTNNKTWTLTDLSKKTKTPGVNAGNQIVAFATTPNNQMHVYYMFGNDVCQLFLPSPSTKWSNTDLTALTHGGSAVGNSGMAGFSLQNLQYVYYLAQ